MAIAHGIDGTLDCIDHGLSPYPLSSQGQLQLCQCKLIYRQKAPLKLIDQTQNLSNIVDSCHKSTNSIFSALPLQNQLEGNTARERRGWSQVS